MKGPWFARLIVVILLLVFVAFAPRTAHAQEGPPPTSTSIESAYLDAAVGGVPLALLPFGLVAYLKKQGVQGKALLFSSLGIGILLGIGYMVYKTRPPTGDWWVIYGYWFANVVYGLGLGLLASGAYEGVRTAAASVLAGALRKTPHFDG